MNFICEICNTSFARKNNLVKHTKRNKCSLYASAREIKNGVSFTCANCNANFPRKNSCARHIKNAICYSYKKQPSSESIKTTKEDPNVTILHFENNADFLSWKDSEEQRTLSKYSQFSGIWKTKTGTKIRYLCHRSGFVRSRLKYPTRKRNFKRKGSCKINNHCPAYMLYEQSFDGKVTVKYNPNHSNHELEIKHVPISSTVKENIAEKLKSGATLDEVLDEIRDTSNDTRFTRTQLITKHELHNIMKEKKIPYQYNKPQLSVDAANVESIIDEYREKFGDDTPFKYYKEQGEIKDQFEEDDFFLVIMNSVQIDLMKQFGCDKICVVSTHATNDYNYYLNSVLVINDLNVAVPTAHVISNKENFQFMKKFFEIIMQECGVICTNTFMSDDFPTYINAWMMVMEAPKNILLCHWHVDKNWSKNLNLITGSKDLKDEVHKLIRSLMEEKNEALFPQVVTSVVETLMDHPDTVEFGKYFEREYSKRYEMWAFAFRKYIGMNLSMEIEAMQKELKYVYCRTMKNKRLDMLITKLLRMSRNKSIHRVSCVLMESDTRALKKIRDQHQIGEKIPAEDISIIDHNTGNVRSQSNQSSNYLVKKTADECDCRLRCVDCGGICVHSYECTCDDSVHGYNICKHIHAYALKILVLKSPLEFIDDIKENDAEDGNLIEIIYTQYPAEADHMPYIRQSMIEVTKQILQNIERCELVEEDEDDQKALNSLNQINKMLEMKAKRIRIYE